MKRFLFPTICALTVLSACLKVDPEVPEPAKPAVPVVKLTVRPLWNGVPFNKTMVYGTAADERVLVQLLKFYLSGLRLVGDDGEALLSEAELINVTDGMETRLFQGIAGQYDSLCFGLGLPEELNHADITNIDPSTPLGNNAGMYWTWATMYRFMVFEGRYDTDPTGTGTPPFPFSIHTGRDECYRERALPLQLYVDTLDTAHMELTIDLARMFTDGQQDYVLANGSQVHGEPETMNDAQLMSDLAIRAFAVE